MTFWIITGVLTLGIAAVLAVTLIRGRAGEQAPAAYDLKVYRDQLKEVDRDMARGVIAEEDAERSRIEIGRRILAADAQLKDGGDTGGQPAGLSGTLIAAAALIAIAAVSYALYAQLGAPGKPDLGLKNRIAAAEELRQTRPGQTEAEATATPPQLAQSTPEFTELMTQLRTAVAERPDDLRGHRLLARNEAVTGDFVAAREAQEKVIALLGDQVQAGDYTDWADLMILGTNGYVSPEAEAALIKALELDPGNGAARYYLGLMFGQVGRPDAAFKTWSKLLDESPRSAPWVPPIRAQILELAGLAGVDYQLPVAQQPVAALPGPSAEQMQAAGDMAPEDREAMIRGMVDGLSDRLATEGGSAAEWARLIGALGVLGETERAAAIWTEAQTRFAETPEAFALIKAAAQSAGVAE